MRGSKACGHCFVCGIFSPSRHDEGKAGAADEGQVSAVASFQAADLYMISKSEQLFYHSDGWVCLQNLTVLPKF